MSSSKYIGLNGEKPRGAIEQQAADWFVAMEADAPSEQTTEAFDEWLAQSAEHREAYLEMELLGDALHAVAQTDEGYEMRELAKTISVSSNNAEPESTGNASTPVSSPQPEPSSGIGLRGLFGLAKPTWAVSLAMSVLAAVVVWNVVPNLSAPDTNYLVNEKRFNTGQGQLSSETLSDGSQITLGPRTEIVFTENTDSRNVKLLKGEAFFNVSTNPDKPFLVDAGGVSVRVVGTMFDVRRQPSGTSVSVIEGVVQVYKPERKEVSTRLTAGQSVVQSGDFEFKRLADKPVDELTTWKNGRLVYDAVELQDVLSDANRYSSGRKILVSANQLLSEKVTLSLNASEVEELPKMLEQLLPIKVQEVAGDTVITER